MHERRIKRRLEARLAQDLGFHVVPGSLRRTYAGRWDLAAGTWSWTVKVYAPGPGGTEVWGSPDHMTECIRRDHVLWKDETAHEIGYE